MLRSREAEKLDLGYSRHEQASAELHEERQTTRGGVRALDHRVGREQKDLDEFKASLGHIVTSGSTWATE